MFKNVFIVSLVSVFAGSVFAANLDTKNTNFVVDYAVMNNIEDAVVTNVSETKTKGNSHYVVDFSGVERNKDKATNQVTEKKVCGTLDYVVLPNHKNKVNKYTASDC